jgi:predicted nucleic acid-binding protein
MILLDSNILIDVWNANPAWLAWSLGQMRAQSQLHELAINPIVYSEVSVSFTTSKMLDERLSDLAIDVLDIPRKAAFLAGKAFMVYRSRGGTKTSVLPDFFIGAHAAVLDCAVLTRDTRRYASYFPAVRLICP